jgi:phosphatidylserine decarboxylase
MEAECGRLALVLVGAMLVSAMELTCCDLESAVRAAHPLLHPFHVAIDETRCEIERGAEIGRFNMGSTVIVVAEAGSLTWASELKHGSLVQVGQSIAIITPRH